jgi:hypothetical protein
MTAVGVRRSFGELRHTVDRNLDSLRALSEFVTSDGTRGLGHANAFCLTRI